ncbi:MAG: 7-carboxy-7-deazaguanine synthase QueE [bacterium]
MKISEIFRSIQGESTYAGLPCVFIRLAGCNLSCSYCDTTYAAESGGREMSVETVIGKVRKLGGELVEITGGEPLLQPETRELTGRLLAGKKTVLLETNGSLPIDSLPPEVIIIMDVKCPGSRMTDQVFIPNFSRLKPSDQIKFVLLDRRDYDYAREMIRKHDLYGHELLMSPVWGKLSPAELAGWILADRLNVRLQLQLHKQIWKPDTRGV